MDEVTGSKLAVKVGALRSRVEGLISRIGDQKTSTKEEVENFHNLYTCYTVLMLQFGTGHRPVADPFCFGVDFNLTEGFVLINDKISSESHKNRLSWMCALQIEQIMQYRIHLDNLRRKLQDDIEWQSSRFLSSGGYIGQVIESLEESADQKNINNKLPCFFLIRSGEPVSLTPASMDITLGSSWVYLLNQNRHMLESQVMEQGVPSWIVNAQMGHVVSSSHAFGNDSVNAVQKIGSIIRPVLEKILNEQGWKVISGYRTSPRLQPIASRRALNYIWTPGPTVREMAREKSASDFMARLANRCQEEFVLKKNVSLEDLQNAQEKITGEILSELGKYPDKLIDAMDLLFDYLHAASSGSSLPYKYSLMLGAEKSPFLNNWHHRFRQSKSIRIQLAEYFEKRANLNPETKSCRAELLAAELVMLAAFVGGVFRESWLCQIGTLNKSKVHNLDGMAFIELGEWVSIDKAPPRFQLQWRWFVDRASLAVLSRLNEMNNWEIDQSILEEELIRLGNSAGIKLSGGLQMICRQLSRTASAYWRFYLPGYLHGVMQGGLHTQILTHDTLWRLKNQQISVRDSTPNDYSEVINRSICGAIKNLSGKEDNKNILDDKLFKKNILKMIREVKSGELDGVMRTSNVGKLSSLANSVDDYLENPSENLELGQVSEKAIKGKVVWQCSELAQLVGLWVIKMCRVGTMDTVNPEISTVATYFLTVFNALTQVVADREDLLNFDSQDFEDLYIDALLVTHDKRRGYLFDRLRDFHRFLELYLGMDVVEWIDIADSVGLTRHVQVSAEIITRAEYEHILQCLYDKKSDQPDNYLFAASAIIFGYRFGLRIGEAHRLRKCDLQYFSDEKIFVQVQNTIEGKTKSFSGRRVVPLLGGKLSAIENYFMVALQKRLEAIPNAGITSPLMADEGGWLLGISRAKLSSLVHTALKAGTQRQNIVFHTLRHTWLNRCWLELFGDVKNSIEFGLMRENAILDERSTWLNIDVAKHGILKNGDVLSEMIGHERFETTLASYLHVCDWLYADQIVGHGFDELSVDGAAYLLGKMPIAIKSQQKKFRIKNSEGMKILSSYKPQNVGEGVKYNSSKFRQFDISSKLMKSDCLGVFHIERLFKFYTLRNREIIHLDNIFNRDLVDIEEYIKIGRDIEKEIGYFRYCFGDMSDPARYLNDIKPDFDSIGENSESMDTLCKSIDEILLSITDVECQILEQGINQWKKSHVMADKSDLIVVHDKTGLIKLIDALEIIGIKRNNLVLKYPADYEGIKLQSFLNHWSEADFTDLHKSKWSSKRLGNSDTNEVRAQLALSPLPINDIKINNKQLSRILFCLAVKLKYHQGGTP